MTFRDALGARYGLGGVDQAISMLLDAGEGDGVVFGCPERPVRDVDADENAPESEQRRDDAGDYSDDLDPDGIAHRVAPISESSSYTRQRNIDQRLGNLHKMDRIIQLVSGSSLRAPAHLPQPRRPPMSATEADILAQSAQILEKAANDRNRATAIANAFADFKALVADLTEQLKEALDAAGIKPAKEESIQTAYDNLKLAIDSLDASAVSDAALLNTEAPVAPVEPAPVNAAPVLTGSPGAPPVISGFSPNDADPDGGTTISITGTGFTGVTAVTFGGVAAPTVAPSHDGALTAVAPAGSGTVDLVVKTPLGDSDPVQFAYSDVSDGVVDETAPTA